MKFDISRDFLDGITLQHPKPTEGKGEVKVNANLQFLPSSPDGRLHTAVVTFSLHVDGEKNQFARGGWRFLFTTDEEFTPKETSNEDFFRHLLVNGVNKITTVLNPLCLHANLPIIPIEASRLVANAQQKPAEEGPAASESAGMVP